MQKNNRNSQNGFTLTEILTVTVIIGIIIGFAVSNTMEVKTTGQDVVKETALHRVAEAKTKYYVDNPFADTTSSPPLTSLSPYLGGTGENMFYSNTSSCMFKGAYPATTLMKIEPNGKGIKPTFNAYTQP